MTRTPLRCLVLAVVAAGCAATSSPTAAPDGSTAASPSPAATVAATTAPSPRPSVSTEPSTAPTASPAPPPQAEILGTGTVFAGYLGSYDIDGRGSDGPWLPFDSLSNVHVGSQDTLTIRFVDGSDIGEAVAVAAAAADTTGSSPQAVPVAPGGNAASVSVGPLPVGKWVLSVRLFRADGRGDGTTYWAMTVA
jgi:hypothetical protein